MDIKVADLNLRRGDVPTAQEYFELRIINGENLDIPLSTI